MTLFRILVEVPLRLGGRGGVLRGGARGAPGGPRGGPPEAGGPGLAPAPVIDRGGKPGGGPDLGGAAGGPRGGGAPPPGGPRS